MDENKRKSMVLTPPVFGTGPTYFWYLPLYNWYFLIGTFPFLATRCF